MTANAMFYCLRIKTSWSVSFFLSFFLSFFFFFFFFFNPLGFAEFRIRKLYRTVIFLVFLNQLKLSLPYTTVSYASSRLVMHGKKVFYRLIPFRQEGPDIRHHWTDHFRITSKFWYGLKENTLVYTQMESAVICICRSLFLELINIKFA